MQVNLIELKGQCVVDDLDISTGYDHAASQGYASGDQDQYWVITSAPNGSNTGCARSWNFSYLTGSGWSSCISDEMPWVLSRGNIKQNCNSYGTPYVFERQYKIELPPSVTSVTGSLSFSATVDDYVTSATLTGPGLNLTMANSPCPAGGLFTYSSGPLTFLNGIYTLKFIVRNLYVTPFNVIGTSMMNFELRGHVTTAIPAIVDNSHFGKNISCAPNYPPSPNFTIAGNTCLPTATSTSTFTITPFNNGVDQNVYNIISLPPVPNIQSDGTFTAGIGTYIVTSTDALGCVYATVLSVYSNPTITLTPSAICIPYGTTTQINVATNPKLWSNYSWQINAGLPFSPTVPYLAIGYGFQTITITDPQSGCQASATAGIGNILNLTVDHYPECLPVPGSVNLYGIATPPTLGQQFSFDLGGTWSTTPYIPVSAAGIYTVFVKDAFGCTASGTDEIPLTPYPTITLSKSQPCVYPGVSGVTITATAVGAGGPFQFVLNGGTPQTSNVFAINSPGTYTVTVIGANGCPSPNQATIFLADCSHCTYQNYPPGLFPTPPPVTTATWYVDEFSSNTGIFPSGPIILDGTFHVDNNYNIFNRGDIYLTENAVIEISLSNVTFVINNSTLQGCGLWGGIRGLDNSTNLVIENGSVIKHMKGNESQLIEGVQPWFSNFIARNSIFEENKISIHLYGNGSATTNLNCTIEGNTFRGINNLGLYDPVNKIGIYLDHGANVTIGDLSDVNKGNIFHHIRIGIQIRNLDVGFGFQLGGNVQLYNNNFYEIHDLKPIYYSGLYKERDIVNGAVAGSAIYAWQSGDFRGHLTVKTIDDDPAPMIDHCDRGIVAYYGLDAEDLHIQNTMTGIILYHDHRFQNKILNNHISNAHLGIKCIINSSPFLNPPPYSNFPIKTLNIENNYITTRNVGVLTDYSTSPVKYAAPVGINLSQYNNKDPWAVSNIFYFIQKNEIYLNAISGVGIKSLNLNRHSLVEDNYVKFNSGDPSSSIGFTPRDFYGYWIENCMGSSFYGNTTMGYNNQSFMLNTRSSTGMLMAQSPKCRLMCNKTKYTRFGFFVWGNNLTFPFNVLNNKFSANYIPWCFVDAGSALPASFGDISDLSHDAGNDFLGSMNWLNPGAYKVARFSNVQTHHKIFTDASLLTQAESIGIPSGGEYLVVNNNTTFTDHCPDPLFKELIEDELETWAGTSDSLEQIQLADIVNEDVDYIAFPDVGKWIDEYRLFEQLDADSLFRYSDSALLSFYNQQQGEVMDDILNAENAISAMYGLTAIEREQKYTEAIAANNLIANGSDWEMNEKYVNDVQIKLNYYDLDSINEQDKEIIKSIAELCPFVGGLSVYRARVIQSFWDPLSFYDDRAICMNVSNKNADYDIDFLDSLYTIQLAGISPEQKLNLVKSKKQNDADVVIYPNPASTEITISYNSPSEGEFVLFNILGQDVYKTYLPKGNLKVTRLLPEMQQGLYNYRIRFRDCSDYLGKLSIGK